MQQDHASDERKLQWTSGGGEDFDQCRRKPFQNKHVRAVEMYRLWMKFPLSSHNSLLRFNKNAMTFAHERDYTELKKFFADHHGRIHKDSEMLFAPQSSKCLERQSFKP